MILKRRLKDAIHKDGGRRSGLRPTTSYLAAFGSTPMLKENDLPN